MTMTYYFDTVTGTLLATRAVLGIAVATVVILVEAVVLYKVGWTVNLSQSSVDETQTTGAANNPSKRFMACLRDSFLANLASTAIGYFLSQYVFFFDFWSIAFWVTAFVMTLVVEALMLWVLGRKSVSRIALAALAMNATSYSLLVVLFGLMYWLGLAAEI